jgi:hypothetical protein
MSVPDGFAVPDEVEPTTGWRAWALARTPDGGPELRPIIYSGEAWPALDAARAKCPPHAHAGHRPPELDCTCGLYAVDGLDRLPAVTGRDVTVIGSVSIWGRLVEHDSGFRAEFGYPEQLRLVCGVCWQSGMFDDEVVAVARTGRATLLGLCEDHAGARSASEPDPRFLERQLLATYAVDRMPDAAVARMAEAWSHPTRRARHHMSFASAAAAVVFFGVLLSLFALAVSLK